MIVVIAQLPAYAQGESFRESRMRENRTSGSTRGEWGALEGLSPSMLPHSSTLRAPGEAWLIH